MSENLFTDFPERVDQLKKYSDLAKLAIPLEDTLGEKGFYKSPNEAMETYVGILSEMGKFAAEMKPHAAEIDRIGAIYKDGEVTLPERLRQNLKRCVELGVFASPVSKKNGGLNMPQAVQVMALEIFAHACPNTALTISCFSMGFFLETYGTPEMIATYLPKIISNECQTSMALTEPNAGSDLGNLRTTGTKQGDHYVVNGTKHFITSGCGDITFALVRTDPKSKGLNGLSVLLVPRKLAGKDNYKVTKIEEKVCLHASPTCEIVFENSIGHLMGQEGMGFKVMASLMNGARLAMGALSIGISQSALEEARQYAKTRVTMGKPIIEHPMIADMLYEMELEIRAMRAMVTEAACAYDWMTIYEKKGDQENFKKWKKRYRRLTPLCKYMCTEKSIVIARNALQILGGYGVCREYPLERLWRETIIYPIYEGASQIQSLMVLKDTLKDVALQATGFLGSLAGAWAESLVARNPVKAKLLEARNELNQGIRLILMSILKKKFRSDIQALKKDKIQDFLREFSLDLVSKKTDLTLPFLWAERFTRITCDYYAMKCMADRMDPKDKERKKWVLAFAELALPRMRLENHYMEHRLPLTLDYMKESAGAEAKKA